MSNLLTNTVAAFAAIMIMATSFALVTEVPDAPQLALIASPILA